VLKNFNVQRCTLVVQRCDKHIKLPICSLSFSGTMQIQIVVFTISLNSLNILFQEKF